MTFRAVRADKTDAGQTVRFVDMDEKDLMDGDVTIRVTHSTVNYKDGLALSGKSPIIRSFPMVLGVDLAGIVETSRRPDFAPGDEVILTGHGLSETHFGGYAERARVNGDWLVKLPQDLTRAETMAIGTAGFTAMLALMAIEGAGLTPSSGPALVTGAAGGVGSMAIALLAKKGWTVVASTGRPGEAGYLKSLGAAEVFDRATLSAPGRPLGKERWAVAIDSVGSTTLANALTQTNTAKRSPAAALREAWTCLRPSRRSSSAASRSSDRERPLPGDAPARGVSGGSRPTSTARARRDDETIPFDRVLDAGARIVKGETRGRLVVTIP